MHGKGVDVHKETEMVDTLYVMHCVTHSGIDDGAPLVHAWDGYGDLMEPVTSQSDGTHTTGI